MTLFRTQPSLWPADQLDSALEDIHIAAIARMSEVHLRGPFWSRGGQVQSPEWLHACMQLTRLGYEVEFKVRQLGHPNVEMFTRVQLHLYPQ